MEKKKVKEKGKNISRKKGNSGEGGKVWRGKRGTQIGREEKVGQGKVGIERKIKRERGRLRGNEEYRELRNGQRKEEEGEGMKKLKQVGKGKAVKVKEENLYKVGR